MLRSDLLESAASSGLLVTASPYAFAKTEGADAFADFHKLPVYRAYVRGLRVRELPKDYVDGLRAPEPLDLLREPDNRQDRKAVAVYHEGHQLGYLPREDNLLLAKLIRRGLPMRCVLIGVQPHEIAQQQLSLEVCLLYPPHPVTDAALEQAEADRMAGLAQVAAKPTSRRRVTSDPLSAGHVWEGYYGVTG